MKLLIIDSLYSSKLKAYNNEIESLTTNEDRISYLNNSFSSSSSGYLEAFQNYGFTTSNTFVNVMNLSGDLNKKNYIFNNIVWEKNNYLVRLGLTNHYFKSPSRMIFNKINTFCPQIVFIQDMNSVSIEMLKFMKSKKIILVGEIASRIPPLKFLKKYDLIFSALPQFVNYFRKNHLKSEYLPLAFNNAVLKKINLPVVRTIPISFVGSISSHRNETINLLKFLCKNVADFRIYGIASKRDLLNNGLLDNYYGEAFGLKMYEVLSNSLITVNRHINLAGDFAANLRIYEATGMGSYLITDYKPNLPLLLPNKSYSSYFSDNLNLIKNEIFNLVHYAQETQMKASIAQAYTLKHHTYFNRVETFVKHLKRYKLIDE